ncbi:MAG: hypothetical protein PT120_20830 [Aphanizomenon gracile PMC649.10]|jgi:mRNA interferase RelE/StbE|nr:hypothetical protein [Aphanizomenon gracile PMC638.10]MDM3857264.1 hypothetical protein [Aphanizomenon gracile PMC649.10]
MSYSVSFESESITDLDNLDQVVRLRGCLKSFRRLEIATTQTKSTCVD